MVRDTPKRAAATKKRERGDDQGEISRKSRKVIDDDTPQSNPVKVKEKPSIFLHTWTGKTEVPQATEQRDPKDFHEEVSTLERGHIYFFYRPKVGLEHAHKMSEVQKVYTLLYPIGEESLKTRLLIIPKKKLPNVKQRSDRVWSFVDIVGDIDTTISSLKAIEYETKKTHEEHKVEGARLIARGVYVIASHKEPKSKRTFNNHVHLAYALTNPKVPHHLQKDFNIFDEGDFIMEAKNPKSETAPHIAHKTMPPPKLQELFGKHKFIPLNPPSLMDYKGAEIVMITAHHYPTELESIGEKLEMAADWEKHKVSLKTIKNELHLAKSDPTMRLEPVSGHWK